MCGGDVEPGTLLTEDWYLDLERRSFMELIATEKTQARIEQMLKTATPAELEHICRQGAKSAKVSEQTVSWIDLVRSAIRTSGHSCGSRIPGRNSSCNGFAFLGALGALAANALGDGNEQANTGRLHSSRDAHPGGQGAARHVEACPSGRHARARARESAGAGAGAGSFRDRRCRRRLRDAGSGSRGINVARIALLLAGFPNNVSGVTLNRFCSSGLQAVATARGPHQARRGRRDDRRGHGEHEHDPDGRQQDRRQRAHLHERREHRHRLRHGHHRGERGGAVEGQP